MTLNDNELFKIIKEFPNYEVSTWGRVFKRGKNEELVQSPTLRGDLTVGLMREEFADHHGGELTVSLKKNLVQYRRSVKVLVAKAFVSGESEFYNTPIQLDGNRDNNHVSNIQWRSRGFAWEYARQFTDIRAWFYDGPILDITNNIQYENIFEAAIAHGSLCKDIRAAIPSGTSVYPDGEKYTYI